MRLNIKNRPLKITHSFEHTLDNKQVKLSLSKNSVLLPVFDGKRDKQVGFLLDGPIGVIADLLVHSNEGAVGEIVEETYSTALLFPTDLPFLTLDDVKEIQPLENIRPYEEIIRKYSLGIDLHLKSDTRKEKGILINTHKPNHIWLMNKTSTYLLRSSEILGRKGENQLYWLSKKEMLVVKGDGSVRTLKDLFALKKAREIFQRYIVFPLDLMFSRLRDLFAKI